MHWIYFSIALALIGVTWKLPLPGWLVVPVLLAVLVLFVLWILGWMASRISNGARNDTQIMSPEELHRLREQAQARKAMTDDSDNAPS
jgi:hypothetical protein